MLVFFLCGHLSSLFLSSPLRPHIIYKILIMLYGNMVYNFYILYNVMVIEQSWICTHLAGVHVSHLIVL